MSEGDFEVASASASASPRTHIAEARAITANVVGARSDDSILDDGGETLTPRSSLEGMSAQFQPAAKTLDHTVKPNPELFAAQKAALLKRREQAEAAERPRRLAAHEKRVSARYDYESEIVGSRFREIIKDRRGEIVAERRQIRQSGDRNLTMPELPKIKAHPEPTFLKERKRALQVLEKQNARTIARAIEGAKKSNRG